MIYPNQIDVTGYYFPHPQLVPDDTVVVEPGLHMKNDGSGMINNPSAMSSASFPVVASGQDRYDVLSVDDGGALSISPGSPIAAGTGDPYANSPAFPPDKLVIAIIKVDETAAVVIDESDITDARLVMGGGGGGGGGGNEETGALSYYLGDTSPSGYIILTGSNAVHSIGSAASGADYASAQAVDLFILSWDSMDDAQAPVSGGRGASGAADFAADKALSLPDSIGRMVIGSGIGAGLTARVNGDEGGAETHSLSWSEMASHTHLHPRGDFFVGPQIQVGTPFSGSLGATYTSSSSGSNGAHDNVAPWIAYNIICKI